MPDRAPTDEELRAHVEGNLKHDYVNDLAVEIASAIDDGVVIAVGYEPGDMTHYSLVFTPLDAIRRAPTGAVVRYGVAGPGATVVSYLGYGATGLDLSCPGFVWGYLGQYFKGVAPASLVALEILFNRVGEEFQRLRGEPVGPPTFEIREIRDGV